MFAPTGGLDKVYWNEKFIFKLPESELETSSHIKLKIVKEGHFTDGKLVGETMLEFSPFVFLFCCIVFVG